MLDKNEVNLNFVFLADIQETDLPCEMKLI